MSNDNEEEVRHYRNSLLWLFGAVLSSNLTVHAVTVIIQRAGLAGHGVALSIAILFGFLFAAVIASLGRVKKLVYRVPLIIVLGMSLLLLWRWSR